MMESVASMDDSDQRAMSEGFGGLHFVAMTELGLGVIVLGSTG